MTMSKDPQLSDFYSMKEVAGILGASYDFVYRHIKNESIPSVAIGKKVFIPKAYIDGLRNVKPAEAKPVQEPDGDQDPVPARDPQSITTIDQLYKACFVDFKLQPRDVLEKLGIVYKAQIGDPAEAYRKIADSRKAQ